MNLIPTDIVTYNPISRKVTFRNLEYAEYLIIAPAKASIISMLGHGSRSTVSTTSSKRNIEVLPVDIIEFIRGYCELEKLCCQRLIK